ncbi:hypothetical protein GQ53DRAFT_755040 [Thozetella sp. PMI_491]|nr:hypothetical protein GQ53DRAFT_755040 [Thozetella sp. PMI_491]
MSHISDCKALVEQVLPSTYKAGSEYVNVDPTPGRVLEDVGVLAVCLYAQSLEDQSKLVHMRMPGLVRFLTNLANNGVGAFGDYGGVRYQFIEYGSKSGTTTPVSSLG